MCTHCLSVVQKGEGRHRCDYCHKWYLLVKDDDRMVVIPAKSPEVIAVKFTN
jgi:hypothetical protein